jgi:hypothetical protein
LPVKNLRKWKSLRFATPALATRGLLAHAAIDAPVLEEAITRS